MHREGVDIGTAGYNNRYEEQTPEASAWSEVVAGFEEKGSNIADRLRHLNEVQRTALDQALNFEGVDRRVLLRLDAGQLERISSLLEQLATTQDSSADRSLAKQIASIAME